MLFPDPLFLFCFLPVVLLVYRLLHAGPRIPFLWAASYVFYGWWDWRFLLLIAATTTLDFFCARAMGTRETRRARRPFVLLSILGNLSLLAFFKYYGFGVEFAQRLAGAFDTSLPDAMLALDVVLPVGISFFVFQGLSYTIDVYRGDVEPTRSFRVYACYLSLFPQLVAGPIVRYRQVRDELLEPHLDVEKTWHGARLFVIGLAKKVLIADTVAVFADRVFDAPDIGALSSLLIAIGVLAYTLQIYFDFSGYSDMAVGIGHMLGMTFPVNFDSPYKSASITEFWRRWHISLSTWLRDYLYIPLGGSRGGRWMTYRNLMLTMLLGGLWHGAGWTFVIWGGYHGGLLAIERALGERNPLRALPRFVQQGICFVLVAIGWVFFRAGTVAGAVDVLAGVCSLRDGEHHALLSAGLRIEHVVMAVAVAIVFLCRNSNAPPRRPTVPATAGLAALVLLVMCFLHGSTDHPFLYFQF